MKIIVDQMPVCPSDCPFCHDIIPHPTCNLLHNCRCEYFDPPWDYEPDCPFLISLCDRESQKNS